MTDTLLYMLSSAVEAMPFNEVYDEWCAAGYNKVQLPEGREIILSWRPGMRMNPQLVNIVKNQLRHNGFVVEETRNWGDPRDNRIGVKVRRDEKLTLSDEPMMIRILAHTWIEVVVRAQYVLHRLGIETHYTGEANGSSK